MRWFDCQTLTINVSLLSQARDVYEEAILTVVTVRDFTQVFDSYAQFEESMIAAKMETTADMGQDEDGVCAFINVGNSPYFYFSACLTLCPSPTRWHRPRAETGPLWAADSPATPPVEQRAAAAEPSQCPWVAQACKTVWG